ncbi:LOW QUALITY PROTEIN: msx2-interacting protein [Micropterus salmoides]|uniref:LOW QUALITY PROTEIN: msx2-interacting protein n=1 Tax=Micropterus salmoides TaxID=27706 RepID=UPI0018EDE5BB|nr:LOW QUALITY PROTEIN: msx2-interacting protein [Micropterus salmoides]
MVRETRHLWVGNLPENVREEKIIEHFKRYGRVESVKVLPKRGSEGGVAAFVDFVDIKSAQKAHNAINKMGDRDLRTDYNEPGTIPSAARGLDDSLSLSSRGRDVSGFTRAAGGAVYGPPTSLHSRDGRYERRLDGTAESRDRAYDHSAYGHHERPGSSFDRQRHYETDYYRDARERTLSTAGSGSGTSSGSGTTVSSGVSGTIVSAVAGSTGTGGSAVATTGGSGGSTSSGVGFYRSHSRSPCRFEAPEPRYESRAREPFTLASVVHRDLYREDRGRRGERSYRHSRSRSPHSTHSRNPSPQRLASQATRPPRSHSGSGSHSRSSSSDSVSSTSSSTSGSDSSSSSSDDSPARSVQSAAVPAPSALPLSSLDKDEPRKSFGIKVQNLPVRSTDTSLKDGLFHEFKKHGKVTSVQIHGASEERYGLVFFRQQEDQEKALGASKGKLFFGMQIDVTAWNGPETESENEFRPLDERIDEFHPKATRTLFIGNLEKTTTYHDLLNIFQRFGEIVDIDIKKVNGAPQYAFLQYCDIASVCKAIKKMDGEYLGNNRLKLGFGKSMPTTCVWLDGLASNTTEQFLTRHFCRYGHVVKVVFDRMKGMALILYNNIEYAQAAVKDTKGWKIGGSKIKVDFANQESQMAFYRSMQASGQDIRDFYDILSERRDDRRTQYEFQAERQYYENVRTPGTYTEDPRRKYPARSREFYNEWDPYQGDYYDPQYFEDPREYREYRADPYEQDIRKYSYLQRERERERERFETDRGRDHGRRTIERSQSPSHISSRRPASPAASPSLSERIPSDSDRRICCRSSERSGSCSSISPPRFEKLEKARTERYNKTDKLEKDRVFDVERGNLVEKEKRTGRKDRGDKDKSEKQRIKKLKVASPIIQACETEPELERDVSPESVLRSKIPKEGSSKGRLDLLPCVVQLTRVKEKEGKLIGHPVQEKQIPRTGSDSPRLASPSADQRSPLVRSESSKSDICKHGKVPRDKNMHSLVEVIDKDAKIKSKKHGKSEMGFDSCISIDIDRLAARKRRFEEKTDRQKRTSEEDLVRPGLHKLWNSAKETDLDKNLLIKGMHRKEHHKDKCVRMVSVTSPKDERDCESNSIGFSLEQQSQLGELPEDSTDQLDSPYLKIDLESSKSDNTFNLTKMSDNGSLDLDELKEQQKQVLSENEQGRGKCRDSDDGDEHFVQIDQNNICTKQIEQSRWFRPKLGDPDKLVKFENLPSNETCDFEKDYIVHDSGKPIQDMTDDDFSSCKRKKLENFDFEIVTAKRERNFASSQKLNDDIYQSITPSIGHGHFSANEEDESSHISVSVLNKERKSSLTTDDTFSHTETLNSLGLTATHFQTSDTELPKLKTNLLGCDEELMQRWERRMKSDTVRMEMTFPIDTAKRENIRKRLGQDLEPGEVQSDSDDDGENKHTLPKSNSSLSYILRERDERMTDLKLSGSLEKNKFYSFALDKTITPDTKALLERAKTLYSSREDNWSFLPSRFPTSNSCSDKDKVELAPRPIPSWYMKKKKIRTDSDEKLHNKKEELKPQDQERQDLFASRFLHSSIFEQDSRRLQHLERKDQDLETGVGRPKPGATEAQPESGIGDIPQEPIVLFHSRFLELQQQKDKDHPPPDTENDSIVVEIKRDEVQNCVLSDKESDPALKLDDKSSSPLLTLSVSPFVPSPKEMSLPEKKELLSPSSDQPVLFVKEEKVEPVLEVPPSQNSLPMEDLKPVAPKLIITPPLALPEPENEIDTKVDIIEPKVKIGDSFAVEHTPLAEDKPPTPGGSLSGFERETVEFTYSDYPKIEEKSEIIKTEPKIENQETKHLEESQKTETDSEVGMPVLETEIKPLPNRRQPKSKRAKPLSVLCTSKPSQTVATEKPATRKSERIDREKLKRASSPRAEVPKASFESKTTSKSPIHASDSEQNLESSLIHGRTRRRNVRSVYATLHEDDQAGKEVVESSRSMRKRGADKEPIQQDVQIPSTNTRRGRPPKRGVKRGEDASPVKGDQQKMVEEETEEKETSTTVEVVKASEGWRSPRTQKLQQTQLTSSAPVNRKGGRIDKQCGSTTVLAEQADLAGHDDSELKPKADSELFGKLSEKAENASSPVHRKEKDLKDSGGKKSTDGDIEKVDTSFSERRQQPEKSVKMKTPRLKRNTKLDSDDKSHSLKNLEIRVSVDDVKGLLRSEDEEAETFEAPTITKNKTVVQENDETKITSLPKESKEPDAQEKEDTLSEPELPTDPAASLLARQMELEQAVENIAKLTVEQPPRPYKEPPSGQPTISPPVIVEPEGEVEEEKRANPASETELAAAIDSITAEETCADADGFTAPPTYTALIPPPESLISPSSNEIMEPETHMVINNILAADSDDGPLTSSPKGPMAESKAAEETPLLETPKKTGKVRAKTPKKSRSRKGAANKKGDTVEEASQPEPSLVKLPESIPEDPKTINSKAVTVTAGATAAASVVTAVATCRRDVTSAITVDTPKEAEQPEVEQPVPKESAFHSGASNISSCKKHPQAAEPSTPALAPAPARPQPVSQFNVPLLRPAKMALSPDWPPRTEESRIYVAPSCHVTVVTPSAPASSTLGTPSSNPPMPPDTKASDIDPSSSTLRKILMEPKYVSASNSNSIHTTLVTSALSDPSRMSENENPSDTVGSRQLHLEERPPLPPQPIHHKPFPLTESQQNCGEKTQHTIISPATSVISRIPMPYDTEETPRISLSNRNTGISIPKQKFRSNSNENNRYHGMDVVEDGARGRSVVETTPFSAGSGPGLRVNTSEGVVVLSYSGQKTEGTHRMRAKISQIPQASAGDIEFQQSVSKSSVKQDTLMTSSQSPTPKVAAPPTVYGHTGVLLTGQSYNSQPVISSNKQESLGCDKSEAPYHTASQGGVVKMFQQPVSSAQVLMYNQAVIQQHGKRGLGTEPLPKKMDISKAVQQSNLSAVMSPHHPSLSGTRMSPSPGIPTDRSALHLKQEPQSPRTAVHSPSPFVKACPSNSPRGTSVVLGHGMPQMSTYHSSMHHPHSEQSSVIIQPHSVTQSMAHEARMNTPPMSGINYVRRGDSLSSPHPGPPQRSNTPQPNIIRDMVLQSHSSPQGSVSGGGGGSSASEEDPRHFNQALNRPSVPQLQSDVMIIHSDHRGLHPSIRMEQYRDMHQRILMHQQLGEQAAVEARQSRTSETGTTSSSNISGPSKSPIVGKSSEHSTKESLKPLEGKLIHPPSNESRIRGVHASSPVMVSPHSHGVQLVHPGGAGSFPVYRDMRGFPSQFTGHSSSGHNLANQGVTSSQVPREPELVHRSKMSQSHGGGSDSKPENSHLRHATSSDVSHISRIPGDTISPSYQSSLTSPMALTHKPDLSLQKGPPAFLPTPPPAGSLQPRPDVKLEHSGHRSVDMVQLLTKYPIVWQGLLALKNDQAAVQLHFVSGNTILAQRSLPPPEGGPLLRIVQRMRLEASQLDSVARRMTVENDYCLLLALPCGRDQEDVLGQTQALKSGFITYLQAKQAAGIINVPNPGSNQPAYVVQIFPPCEFSESHLSRLAPDLLNSISSISPHLMIVIASV